jgi:small subunit ribosomal protein S16
MLRIRLRRVGGKKQPSYRIVVAESTAPRDGKFVEIVGFHNPRTEPETVQIKEERALYWLSVGAQPSDAVARLLKKTGTLARFERLKAGESLEALAEEATAVEQAPSPKTDDLGVPPTTQDLEPAPDVETVTEGDDSE